jgi:stage III sporulation protein AA
MIDIYADNLDEFTAVFPKQVSLALHSHEREDLLEVVCDLGRKPLAIYPDTSVEIGEEMTQNDLELIRSNLGDFGGDHRAGIPRTLHRFSALYNRSGEIIGITARVGRFIKGPAKLITDYISSGKSVILLGKPGIGKTTLLRETAHILSTEHGKRVMIVDTSNEIAGDGDIPHVSIGRSRRIQVQSPEFQHEVMIEAVENHMPEVIIIDEIGTTKEAEAARTIAERGVQLIATAHGQTLENVMRNPSLSDLVGGVQAVTLSDEEAKKRRTQKTILERIAEPTFDILVEIPERWQVRIHEDTAKAVDSVLRDKAHTIIVRNLTPGGIRETRENVAPEVDTAEEFEMEGVREEMLVPHIRLYSLGIPKRLVVSALKNLHLQYSIVQKPDHADVILISKTLYKKRPTPVRDAERSGVPLALVRENSISNIESVLMHMLG